MSDERDTHSDIAMIAVLVVAAAAAIAVWHKHLKPWLIEHQVLNSHGHPTVLAIGVLVAVFVVLFILGVLRRKMAEKARLKRRARELVAADREAERLAEMKAKVYRPRGRR